MVTLTTWIRISEVPCDGPGAAGQPAQRGGYHEEAHGIQQTAGMDLLSCCSSSHSVVEQKPDPRNYPIKWPTILGARLTFFGHRKKYSDDIWTHFCQIRI